MKLKPQYSKFEELYKLGFMFNPDQHVFYSENPKDLVKPTGYEEWEVEFLDLSVYGTERFKQLGITDENNIIQCIGGANTVDKKEQIDESIFYINKRGAIEILQYGLNRKPYLKDKNADEKKGKGTVKGERYVYQTRLHPWEEHLCEGKYDFKFGKNAPFWSPELVEMFEKKVEVPTLVITEGQFKARKGCIEGVPTVGLTSISHFRDSELRTIHPEIIQFIKDCKVKKLVVLWDGDCLNISSSDLAEQTELTRRPAQFYGFAKTIRGLVQEFMPAKKLQIFFATIKSYQIDGEPKGLDDLFVKIIPTEKTKVVEAFDNIGELPSVWLDWVNITLDSGVKKMRNYFGIDHVTTFYKKHAELINGKSFVYYGSTYKVEKGVPIIEISKDLKTIKRIGDEYYQLIDVPVPNGKKGEVIHENRLVPRKKGEIAEDNGKDCFKSIEKFKGFTNVASHIDYKEVISEHWNLYYNVDHKTEEGDFPTIKKFLKHLFEEHYDNELIFDYLTVLYRFPMQKLPVVCLVSKEQETGKSTFLYLMKLIFKQNLSVIANDDLTSDFNSHWTSSLIVASEETLLEKKDGYEKIKSLSTAFEINRNEKNKTSSPIPCMLHFIFCSNHEDDFIKIDDYDSRLWIRKIKARTETIHGFDQLLESEIAQFVHFIANREIKYQSKGDRLFFAAKDFDTHAKRNVVQNSEPMVVKEIRSCVTEYFHRFDREELLMTAENIKQYFQIKGERTYLNKVIKQFMNPDKWANEKGEQGVTTYSFCMPKHDDENSFVSIKDKGRPFVFKRAKFIQAASI